ncbi:MAG: hypothetical protein N4J56_007682 [Chroococcidiopsis sp. SAG 2025]|uniref:hypothetical protein n=1 Tax=Chroococcidiopsis sp. SAG 2025 TaxID=171389 RepID=UPI002937019D|nr:hypothetical protein [Chroococcidiopsis sp. SAG 2025]MDV2997977.1 hypothetical protein [Chroococcidiopsis sp. SAG 2025]
MPNTGKVWSGLLLTQNQRDEWEIRNGFPAALNRKFTSSQDSLEPSRPRACAIELKFPLVGL